LPEQTASNELVDIVVRGEGELAVKDLAKRVSSGEAIDDVAGITYKAEGATKSTP
jgi:radical SAM superfamily enzyme YgiQ (UPF0313 family)